MVMGRNGYGPKWSWAEMVMGRNDPESLELAHTFFCANLHMKIFLYDRSSWVSYRQKNFPSIRMKNVALQTGFKQPGY